MDQVCTIRQLVRREGVSIRAVAKQLGISRVSVRRYLRDDLVPGARRQTVRAKPRQEAVSKRVEEILNDAPKWTGGKQRLTGVRLHEMLSAEGITIGVTTLYRYLKERRRKTQEVFVPLQYAPGDLAEVDFFEVLVDLMGAWLQRAASGPIFAARSSR